MQKPEIIPGTVSYEDLFKKSKNISLWDTKQLEISEAYALKDKETQGKPYVSMGEIYYAYLGVNVGSEIDKERPVLVFQGNDHAIKASNIVIVIPITSNVKVLPYKIIFGRPDVADAKGVVEGATLVQQIRAISKARLTLFKGKLCDGKLHEVADQLHDLFYKNIPLFAEGDAQTIQKDAARSLL